MNENRPVSQVIPVSVSAPSQVSALIISTWAGEIWVLPWAQLAGSRFNGPDHDTRLELSFAKCSVTITGENLRGLLADLAAQRVGTLRDLPAEFRPRPDKGRPFIAQIEIRASATDAPIREAS